MFHPRTNEYPKDAKKKRPRSSVSLGKSLYNDHLVKQDKMEQIEMEKN